MEAAQYWIGIVHVVSFPPIVLAWVVTHQFIDTWRRIGIARTYVVLGAIIIPCCVALGFLHEPLMAVRYGVSWPLVAVSIVVEGAAWWLGILRMRQAGGAVISGYRELTGGDADPADLVTEGVYSRIRHPRYVELGLHVAAVALFSNTLATWCLLGVFIPGVGLMVHFEEKELRQRFGDAYADYCRSVPRFVPKQTDTEGYDPDAD